jgi:D-glycero-alpha-D-manno-heptose-7-phosphate kinase
MIITRSPLRITLGGGGTDLPSYYEKFGGSLISAAITKYVYITLHENFSNGLIVKYSKTENVENSSQIEHPIIRNAFEFVGIDGKGLELSSMADIPSGTGLGSSSSFTTALLKALHVYKKNIVNARELAEQACHIELDLLKEPIGKQDQFISTYGGITQFTFNKNGLIQTEPLRINEETLGRLSDNLLLFFTGYSRSASNILKEQDQKSKQDDKKMNDNLHFVKEIGFKSKNLLENGDLVGFAELMNIHWQHKKKRSNNMSNSKINHWYDSAIQNGAIGGKLIGAGGGGFLMFYSENKEKLRKIMYSFGLKEVRFNFDFEGTKQIMS